MMALVMQTVAPLLDKAHQDKDFLKYLRMVATLAPFINDYLDKVRILK